MPAGLWSLLWSLLSGASGENAAQAAALVMGAFTDFQHGTEKLAAAAKLLGITPPAPAAPAPVALSVEDEEARVKCLAFLEKHAGPHAAAWGDGKLAGRIGDFLKNNPWILTLLMSLLKGAVPTG